MANYTTQLNNLKNAQKNAAVADLQNTRDQALSSLNAEQQQNAANYAAQRNTANAQNRLSARNFQEYLANTGRANSGLAAQANMQHANNLNTSMNNIYGAENAALADIARRRTDAQNAYSSGLASANANIEANYIQNLLKQQQQDWENKMALKQFNESVRQYNLNRQDSLRGFSSGGRYSSSGGRSGAYTSYGSDDDPFGNDSPTSNINANELLSKYTSGVKNAAKKIVNSASKSKKKNSAASVIAGLVKSAANKKSAKKTKTNKKISK